jgi:hypothetical protein
LLEIAKAAKMPKPPFIRVGIRINADYTDLLSGFRVKFPGIPRLLNPCKSVKIREDLCPNLSCG